jgi:hypothetical protein
MSEWRSTVLTCYVDDNHCGVCRFISGSKKYDDMLETIKVLDTTLSEVEEVERRLLKRISELIRGDS